MDELCACRYGFRLDSAKVLCLRRHLGDVCKRQEDCKYAVEHSVCQNGQCICALGHRQGSNHFQCVARKLRERCSRRPDCDVTIKNSNCTERRCGCLHGYLSSWDRTSCDPWPEPHDVALVTFCVAAISIVSFLIIFFTGLIFKFFV